MKTPSAIEMRKNAKGAWCYLRYKINDILDYAQIMSNEFCLHLSTFSLSKLVEYMRKITLHLLASKRDQVGVNFGIRGDVQDNFRGDRERLEQVLFNFISNSVQYTNSGIISLSISHPNGNQRLLEFSVSDTGCGMSSECLAGLFQLKDNPHRHIHKNVKSASLSGLGLTTSRMICNRMDSDIKASSSLGKGTIFSFCIEYEDKETDKSGEIPAEFSPRSGEDKIQSCRLIPLSSLGKVTSRPTGVVLIVDDNTLNRLVVKSMIQKMGYRTEEAENGEIAVSKAESLYANSENKWILIFMDLNMPVMDGIEATIEIRKRIANRDKIFITALTAFSAELERTKCTEVGMDHFLGKPVTKQKLVDLFETLKLKF